MKMSDYPKLHLDTNNCKGTRLLLLFYISHSKYLSLCYVCYSDNQHASQSWKLNHEKSEFYPN